jgi:hypothetical protein
MEADLEGGEGICRQVKLAHLHVLEELVKELLRIKQP